MDTWIQAEKFSACLLAMLSEVKIQKKLNESNAGEDALKQIKDLWVLVSGEEAVKHHTHLTNPWQPV